MRRTIKVFLGDNPRLVGRIRYNAEGARESAAFEYDASWLSAPDGFSIDPALQLVSGAQFHKKTREGSIFHAAIADTEPDGWSRRITLRDHAKRIQEARRAGADVDSQPLNHLDFLLEVDDASRVGALRFQDEEGIFRRAPEPGRRTAPPLIELARLAAATRSVETNSETAADLAYLRGRGTSLGGLRPKCTVVDEEGLL
ncbi:MAG: HipA N-terminal domain-containing protein, partial [Polyangiaceae bacterium]